MTVKLNLTIDEKIVAKSKRYAARKKTTVSKLVQELLRKQLEKDISATKGEGFVGKWAGTLNFHVKDVKQEKEESLKRKYGY